MLNPDWNPFKHSNKEYDETLYPLDHERSGHIRDFSLFNHFVKPMPAGVTVTAVIDACHSGAVLELPYSYRPSDGGMIRMQRNMSSLSNLAFLYLLAGGMLPHGFDNVAANIEDVTGGNLDDYYGMGMDDAGQDGDGYTVPEDAAGYTEGGEYADAGDYADGGGEGPGVDGESAPDFGDGSGYAGPGDGPRGYGGDDGAGPIDFGPPGGDAAPAVQGYDVPDSGPPAFSADNATGPGFAPSAPTEAPAYDGDQMWGDGGDVGDATGWGDTGGGWDGGDGGDVPDMDCGCLADVLGALLEE